jgi:hypothetical protein
MAAKRGRPAKEGSKAFLRSITASAASAKRKAEGTEESEPERPGWMSDTSLLPKRPPGKS